MFLRFSLTTVHYFPQRARATDAPAVSAANILSFCSSISCLIWPRKHSEKISQCQTSVKAILLSSTADSCSSKSQHDFCVLPLWFTVATVSVVGASSETEK